MKKQWKAVTGLFIFLLPLMAAGAEAADAVRAPAVLPGCTAEMNRPEFWINRIAEPDRVIMSMDQIRVFNAKNAARTVAPSHPYAKDIERIEKDGPIFAPVDPLTASNTVKSGDIRNRLEENDRRLARTTLYDRWELPLTEEKKTEIRAAVNLDGLAATVRPRTGIIVRRTSARLYPTAEPAYILKGYLDDFNVTSLDIGMPVAVLHTSRTGDYFFVLTPVAWGWAPALDIAFAPAAKIRAFRDAAKFIVVTSHMIPFQSDSASPVHAGCLFMGERLPLDGKSAGGYRVLVPERDFNGALSIRKGFVPSGETVHEGFLPYTQRNVIATAFRLLGRPYGWHDSWDERDCGGIMRVIFNCFGISLPRYWSFEQLSTDHAVYVGDLKDLSQKAEKLNAMPPGITFTGSTGHIGLYLGNVEGKPFVIHQCGWSYKEGETEYKMARVVVSDYEHVGFNLDGLGVFAPIAP